MNRNASHLEKSFEGEAGEEDKTPDQGVLPVLNSLKNSIMINPMKGKALGWNSQWLWEKDAALTPRPHTRPLCRTGLMSGL
jgi:hypothetical protein